MFNFRFGNSIVIDMIEQDMAEFINTFRNRNIEEYMDVVGWSHNQNNTTYDSLKEQMLPWRTSKYLPSLKKTGANIFELNCGVGLNLFMTYEIIQQSQPKDDIRDVHLYGTTTSASSSGGTGSRNNNDDKDDLYAMRTAVTANLLLDTILQKEANFVGGGKRGMICPTIISGTVRPNDDRGNIRKSHPWMDLSFIPDNSFDLVYTSYVPMARDLWDTSHSVINNEEFLQRHRDLCRTKGSDWKSSTLYNESQQEQEMIYGQYVSEMIRITKPGNVIAIEHVPMPFCLIMESAMNDVGEEQFYGGVGIAQSFWYNNQTHERYQWNDIDMSTIEIEMDTSSALRRSDIHNNIDHTHYHVVMKKAKK